MAGEGREWRVRGNMGEEGGEGGRRDITFVRTHSHQKPFSPHPGWWPASLTLPLPSSTQSIVSHSLGLLVKELSNLPGGSVFVNLYLWLLPRNLGSD